MEIELKTKTAIVCGSTQGIGKAAALELAENGANIVLVARSEEKLKQTLGELNVSSGQKHTYLVADFSNPSGLAGKLDNYIQQGGDCHILINNTGGPKGGPIIDAAPEEFINTFNQHLVCNHILVQKLVPLMKRNGYGR